MPRSDKALGGHLKEKPSVTSWWARYIPELWANAATYTIPCRKIFQQVGKKNYKEKKIYITLKNKRVGHLGQRFNCIPVEGGGDRTP